MYPYQNINHDSMDSGFKLGDNHHRAALVYNGDPHKLEKSNYYLY